MAPERKQAILLCKDSTKEECPVLCFVLFINYLVYHMNERGKKIHMRRRLITPTKQKDVCILSYSVHEKYHANDLPLEFISPL